MASKRELKIAYGVAIYFLFIGVISYAAFPDRAPENPVRIMYQSMAGKVLFTHKTHTDVTGYGLSCADCHHHPADDEEPDLSACGDCHLPGQPETLPESCNDCHEPDEIEDTEMVNRADAFHGQCIGCHQEFEAGPRDCSECHVL